ncbi:MAG: DUF2683 family protein [Nanoarchaeota archaeon]|nr:DUF2683 family protein [Nanoarchaeota archaeon]
MVQAVIDFNEDALKVVNTIKGVFGFKNKSQAVNMIINKFEQESLEPELSRGYIKRLSKIRREKGIKFKDIDELRGLIEK